MSVIERIGQEKVIAIVRLDDLSSAVALSQALLAGGVTIIEFTLTNPDAPRAIANVCDALGDAVLVGAGSVVDKAQVQTVAEHGAQFVVSPVTKHEVIDACHQYNLPTMPGAYTPSEIQAAWELSVAAVKLFPARHLGATYIKDVLAPLPHLRLIPTGGISVDNLGEYIKAGVFAVGIGGALCDKQAIASKDWQSISSAAEALVKALP